jgi:hypothetical protein
MAQQHPAAYQQQRQQQAPQFPPASQGLMSMGAELDAATAALRAAGAAEPVTMQQQPQYYQQQYQQQQQHYSGDVHTPDHGAYAYAHQQQPGMMATATTAASGPLMMHSPRSATGSLAGGALSHGPATARSGQQQAVYQQQHSGPGGAAAGSRQQQQPHGPSAARSQARSEDSFPCPEGYRDSPLNVYSRAVLWQRRKEQRLDEMRHEQGSQELQECTFDPTVVIASFRGSPAGALPGQHYSHTDMGASATSGGGSGAVGLHSPVPLRSQERLRQRHDRETLDGTCGSAANPTVPITSVAAGVSEFLHRQAAARRQKAEKEEFFARAGKGFRAEPTVPEEFAFTTPGSLKPIRALEQPFRAATGELRRRVMSTNHGGYGPRSAAQPVAPAGPFAPNSVGDQLGGNVAPFNYYSSEKSWAANGGRSGGPVGGVPVSAAAIPDEAFAQRTDAFTGLEQFLPRGCFSGLTTASIVDSTVLRREE